MNFAHRYLEIAPAAEVRPRTAAAPLLVPVALLVVLSGLIWWWDLDRVWQRAFWSPAEGWFLKSHPVVQFLHRFGTWPALVVGGLGGMVHLASWITGRWREWRPIALFLALLLVVGPGLLVNVLFKEHFGRARPVQTQAFGGKLPFSPLGQSGYAGGGKSFPCGHASMGFYWLGLPIYFWNQRRGLAWVFLALGIVHGSVMGLGRMAQGGHWSSDVLWSAGLIYLAAWLIQQALSRLGPKASS